MISLLRVGFSSSGLLIAWGVVVGSGILLLEGYSVRPGSVGSPPALWPKTCLVRPAVGRSTLLIFIHPRCPCSQASVEELAYILRQSPGRVTAHAILLSPKHPSEDSGWSGTDEALARSADLHVWRDSEGAEARRFGAETSGHVVLYDAFGRLTYSGGITAARGHRGSNDGRATVIDRIFGQGRDQSWFPVFGCPLLEPEQSVGAELAR